MVLHALQNLPSLCLVFILCDESPVTHVLQVVQAASVAFSRTPQRRQNVAGVSLQPEVGSPSLSY
jgi:hypothetical protein